MANVQRFERREYKYLVPAHVAEGIRRAARINCSIDDFAGPTGTYRIRSLYLDTTGKDLYWANEREQSHRFKARIRSYPGTGASPVFLEIKGRAMDVIVKDRIKVPRATWDEVTAGMYPRWSLIEGGQHFLRRVIAHHLEPVCLVEYEREAYVSHTESYGRLTLDSYIGCQPMDKWCLEADPNGWRLIDNMERTWTESASYVLELKFENMAPRWMVNLVQRFDLMRYSFSKYCYSVDALNILPSGINRSPARRHAWSG